MYQADRTVNHFLKIADAWRAYIQIILMYSISYKVPTRCCSACFVLVIVVLRCAFHDDGMKWKHFPRYWPFVRGIQRSPVNSPHKGQWRGALMSFFIFACIKGWVHNRKAGDLRRHRAQYNISVMQPCSSGLLHQHWYNNESIPFFFKSIRKHGHSILT